MDRIKTYVINLPKDQDRRESILRETSRFSTLDIEMMEAVYGKELADQEREDLFDSKKYSQYYGRNVLPGEIGCTLSHRKCYKRLLYSDWKYALVLEDDAHFLDDAFDMDFLIAVEKIMNTEKPSVLLLHADINYQGKANFFCKNYALYSVYTAMFTTAYFINRSAAGLMLHEKRSYWVADDWFRFRQWGIDILCLYPSAIVQQWDELASSIAEEKRLYIPKRKFPHSLIECRLAYEKIIFMILKGLKIIKHIHG